MTQPQTPFLSRVKIKNFRNFLDVDVKLGQKQVIIGENNVGKTNFLRAIQLILDRSFTDADRELTESDFHDSLDRPMESGKEIEVSVEIQGYEHNRKLLAQFHDAAISDKPPTIKITYKYRAMKDENGNIVKYTSLIYKGDNEDARFSSEDRSFINIYVIKALRDVERELRSNKNSPLYKLVKQYDMSSEQLEAISDELEKAAAGILKLDEIVHIREALSDQFTLLSGLQIDNELAIRPFDVDTERLLISLQIYLGIKERAISELSLGLGNILYISLMLLLIRDRTIIPVVPAEQFENLSKLDKNGVLAKSYKMSPNGNYVLGNNLSAKELELLYKFMDQNNYRHQSFTILAIEEPEAHLHPILQRLLYREVLHNSENSVIFSSHSTHIASVAPIRSIVHVRRMGESSKIYSAVELVLDEREEKDIERYVDAKRGEIFFGKGIILVEGITEEYIVPAAADLLGTPIDDYGIIVCNINSTNFRPYVSLLNQLSIPWILLTDGDCYQLETERKEGKDKVVRKYHRMVDTDLEHGFNGHEIVEKILIDLGSLEEKHIPKGFDEQYDLYKERGCFIGYYTLEVDMMDTSTDDGLEMFKKIYAELIEGGREMRENFEALLDNGSYWLALKRIENNISKGRFAQRLAGELMIEMIPSYVSEAIESIVETVEESYE